MADSIQVGDAVRVPGGMHGTVRFVGAVEGKAGRFAGIDLDPKFAGKGRNNGDFNGRQYFETCAPNSGIFAPLNNPKLISKINSASSVSPARPAFGKPAGLTPPSAPGSGIRRPSLQRPESPAVNGNGHANGQAAGNGSPSTPKFSIGSLRAKGGGLTPSKGPSLKGGIRTGLRMGSRPSSRLSGGSAATSASQLPPPSGPPQPQTSPSPLPHDPTPSPGPSVPSVPSPVPSADPEEDVEPPQELTERMRQLELELQERDRQLEEQTAMLEELQESITELEALDIMQVRAQLREKTEKIAALTQEFDNHRADFRSTLDTLEIAAAETERVYETRIEELMQANRELQERGEDVETVARQLKQLEELVSELEEGLEDARRGETEAKGEVEFLRGEVERTKLELKQEKERSATALRNAEERANSLAALTASEADRTALDQKDERIRSLEAIIDSLQTSDGGSDTNGHMSAEDKAAYEKRIQELEQQLSDQARRMADLERELQASHNPPTQPLPLRPKPSMASSLGSTSSRDQRRKGSHNHTLSDRTVVPNGNEVQQAHANGSHLAPRTPNHYAPRAHSRIDSEIEYGSSPNSEETLWCEICETSGHEILTCTNMFGSNGGQPTSNNNGVNHSAFNFDRDDSSRRPSAGAFSNGSRRPSLHPPPSQGLPETPRLEHAQMYAPSFDSQDDARSYLSASTDQHEQLPNPHQQYQAYGRRPSGTKPAASPGATSQRSARDVVLKRMRSNGSMGPLAGKESGVVDESKWCALCERDGHESIDCPFDE